MICWEDSTQDEFEKQLRILLKEFKEYRFDIEPIYKIESARPHQKLSMRLLDFLKFDAERNLLIIYYGGHGVNSQDNDNIWLR